jgi:RHS repeat-associated protein
MRTNGTLYYLLGDHLGSTSLTTDANGQVVSEMRYKAWGEVRYASGDMPTSYQFNGQYSYEADFGLYFYNARWIDVSLGRFAQADSIVPGGIQGLDRYAYVNNSPINYTDPSGHGVDCGRGDPGCQAGHLPKPPAPTSNCKDPLNCQAAYETLKQVIDKLGRMPTMTEIIRMTTVGEIWGILYNSTTTGLEAGRAAFQEGLARAYYQICGQTGANCNKAGDALYLFLSGYQPWLGRTCDGAGNCVINPAKAENYATKLVGYLDYKDSTTKT